jgi:hypothetical protein
MVTVMDDDEPNEPVATPVQGFLPVNDLSKMDAWRAQAKETQQRDDAGRWRRQLQELEQRLVAQFEERFATEREAIIDIVGNALGEYRLDLAAETTASFERTFAKMNAVIDELRAEITKLNGGSSSNEQQTDIPRFLPSRHLQ